LRRKFGFAKKIAKTFNKRREDFPSLRVYNDYLEEVEEITWNLILDQDIEATQAKVKKYEQENQAVIAINEAKKANEDKFAQYQQEIEKKQKQARRDASIHEKEKEKREREEVKAEVIQELATSNKSAKTIVANRLAVTLKRSSALTQAEPAQVVPKTLDSFWRVQRDDFEGDEGSDIFDPLALHYAETNMYAMQDSYFDASTEGFATNKAARAGGYSVAFAYRRALDDAVAGLLLRPIEGGQPVQ